MRRWLREPLLHFLLAALLLYVGHALLHPAARDAGHVIHVDRRALLEFLQYRASAFAPDAFATDLDALDARARQALVDDYVREEALLREARALGLAEGDYVIRQRLVQRLGFVLEDAAAPATTPDDDTLESWYRAHAEDYREPASYTFTHVFLDRARHGDAEAEALAGKTRSALQASHAKFADAARFGERFPFLLNYVERTDDFVRSHFGAAFLESLERLQPDANTWQGPFRSDQGWHLVLVTAKQPARLPPLQDLRARIVDDWQREQTDTARRRAIERIVAGYRVEREL